MSIENISIIGAGLAGLTLALALHQQSIPVTVYESRPEPLNIGGAVMLSPNALKVLDALDLYSVVKTKGYNFEKLHFRNLEGDLIETYDFGGQEQYGYDGLRIYRYVLIDELVAALEKRGVPVRYGVKFSHVVEDNASGVSFALTNGETISTSLLVGADGIHSAVRKHIYPDLSPKFTGMVGITAAVPLSQVNLPEGYHIPATIMSPNKGAFVIAPQQIDGSEVLIGKQLRVSTEGREPGWDRAFVTEKQSAIEFLQGNNDEYPQFVRDAVTTIDPAKVNKWPFFIVPKLDRWISETGRVIILGDAAHAIPPSAGQGINQAFEDVYLLALLLAQRNRISDIGDALAFWQSYRQDRVNRVLKLNEQIDKRRMPKDDSCLEEGSKEPFELEWLYSPELSVDVENWISAQKA